MHSLFMDRHFLCEAVITSDCFTNTCYVCIYFQVSKDGTRKRAYELVDGQVIESVLMPYSDGRQTACISSQVRWFHLFNHLLIQRLSHVCGLVSQINVRLDAAWVVFSVPLVKWVSLDSLHQVRFSNKLKNSVLN